MNQEIEIREVTTVEEFRQCIRLQREAFKLPDEEISPVRHLIVTNSCGGFVLGAFAGEQMVGFTHYLIAVRGAEIIGYSHMAAIAPDFQNAGIGARLKWAQRAEALRRGHKFIKWTFEPMLGRNAHFNLNRLGAVIRSYAENYYGTDFNPGAGKLGESIGIDSDRLFAEWNLDSERVLALEKGEKPQDLGAPAQIIEIPANWKVILEIDPQRARDEQLRVRREFQTAFSDGLICAKFERGEAVSKYLLFRGI